MGNKTTIYKKEVKNNLNESFNHSNRLKGVSIELTKVLTFPINKNNYAN